MDLEQYASWSNLAMASATVILGLAWLAFVAEWAFTKVGTPRRERVLVGAGTPLAPAGAASGGDRSDAAARVGLTLTVLGTSVLLLGVLTRGLAAQRVMAQAAGASPTNTYRLWMRPSAVSATSVPVTTGG